MQFSHFSKVSLLTLALASTSALAQVKPHSYGLTTGIASGEYKNSSNDGDGFAQAYFFYNYQFADNFSIELAYARSVEIDDWSWDCDEIEEDSWKCTYDDGSGPLFNTAAEEFELDNFIVAIKADLPISERNSLYAKLGAQYYDYELYSDDSINKFWQGDTGTGLFLEAGWQYRWNCGIGMNVGLRYQDMDDLTFVSPNVGINYAF